MPTGPTMRRDLVDADADREMNWVIGLIEGIRSARAQMHVPAGLKVPMLVTNSTTPAAGRLGPQRGDDQAAGADRSLSETDELPKGAITIPVEGGSFGLPLAGIIDVAEEKARLEKALAKLEKELGGLKGRLSNPKFVASAPDDVVEETRETAAAKQDEADKLKAALARLAEVA